MTNQTKIKTILCIPGNWKDRTDIVTSIVQNNFNEFMFVGHLLMNLKTKQVYEMEIQGHDDQMKKSFGFAGMSTGISEPFLDEIGRHTHVIYLIGETGTPETAKAMAKAGTALLNAGGTGLKVESAGKAFSKEHWIDLTENDEMASLYRMYVIDSISDGNSTFSCGMHHLGYKDSIVSGLEFKQAVELLSVLGYYQVIEKPVIKTGQTFSTKTDAPVFLIVEEPNQPYAGDELFENPFGMWRLNKR